MGCQRELRRHLQEEAILAIAAPFVLEALQEKGTTAALLPILVADHLPEVAGGELALEYNKEKSTREKSGTDLERTSNSKLGTEAWWLQSMLTLKRKRQSGCVICFEGRGTEALESHTILVLLAVSD